MEQAVATLLATITYGAGAVDTNEAAAVVILPLLKTVVESAILEEFATASGT